VANYNVDISIAIKNTSKLTAFNKQLDKSSQRAKELNQGLSEITRTAKSNFASLNNLSNALTQAQKKFNQTVLGTKASVLAARDLATAERMVNKELKERTALMNKFRFQGGGSAFKSFSQRANQITSPNVLTNAQQKSIDRQNRKRGITPTPFGPQPMVNQPFPAVSLTSPQAIRDRIINRRATNFARTGTASSFPRSEGFLAFSKSADKIAAGVKQNVIHTKKTASILTQQATRATFEGMPFGVKGGQIGAAPPPTFFNKMGFGKNANAGGMFAMQGGPSARLKGGIGSALIGGGFPALFGAGGISSVFGGVAGGVGGALAPGGGFAASIFATAIAAQIEKAIAFNKAVDDLNVSIRATGGTSLFSSKQVAEFAKSLGMTKDEALEALKAFKQFEASARIALTQTFGSEATFDIFAGLKDNASLINALPGLSKELSLNQAQRALDTLKTKGATAAEDQLLKGIINKNSEIIKQEAVKLNFLQRQLSKLNPFRGKGLSAITSGSLTMDEAGELRGEEALENNRKQNDIAMQKLEIQRNFNEELERQAIIKAPVDELNRLLDPLTQIDSLSRSIGDSFAESFKGIINGSMTAKEALRNLFMRTADHFLDMAAQIVAAQIRSGIMGMFSGMFSGFGGGFKAPAPMKPGFMGTGIPSALPEGSFGISSIKRAGGGPVKRGGSYIVGERGPEMFSPGVSGMITPNHALGGSTNIVVNVDASGSAVEGDEEQGRQLGNVLSAAIQAQLIQEKRPGGLLA
jgi:hypothetical protein